MEGLSYNNDNDNNNNNNSTSNSNSNVNNSNHSNNDNNNSNTKSKSNSNSNNNTATLPPKIIAAKIRRLKISCKPPMDMRVPPLTIKIVIESNPLKSII